MLLYIMVLYFVRVYMNYLIEMGGRSYTDDNAIQYSVQLHS